VVLLSRPTATVTIMVSFVGADVTVNTNILSFAPGSWNVPRTIVVTAVDDGKVEPFMQSTMLLNPPISSDALYAALPARTVTVTVIDNDIAGVTVAPTSFVLDEANVAPTNFTVRLTSEPTADVTINFTYAGNDFEIGPAFFTFTPANWNLPQTNYLLVNNDFLDEPAVENDSLAVTSVSMDPAYNTYSQSLTVAIYDNDVTAYIVATQPDAKELGPVNGEFTVNTSKSLPSSVTIYFNIQGTAENSVDYNLISNYVNVAAGTTNRTVPVVVKRDQVAETNETVQLVLQASGQDYIVGNPDNATVTIEALPYDLWKVGHFGLAQANSTNAADGADWDADGRKNLMEYVLNSDPKVVNSNYEFQVEIENTATGKWFTVYYSKRSSLPEGNLDVHVDVTTNLVGGAWTSGVDVVHETFTNNNGILRDMKVRLISPAITNTPAANVRLNATND
jgi:hypothetical protein